MKIKAERITVRSSYCPLETRKSNRITGEFVERFDVDRCLALRLLLPLETGSRIDCARFSGASASTARAPSISLARCLRDRNDNDLAARASHSSVRSVPRTKFVSPARDWLTLRARAASNDELSLLEPASAAHIVLISAAAARD